MECSICFEKFFRPTNKEELQKIRDENIKDKNNEEDNFRFYNFVITPTHNMTYKCPTNNCECILCCECYTKYTCNGKDMNNMTDEDMPSKYDTFCCPFCRNIDWKSYMERVFDELQYKVLGDDALNLIMKRKFPELMNNK
jgi:hypothetical protein